MVEEEGGEHELFGVTVLQHFKRFVPKGDLLKGDDGQGAERAGGIPGIRQPGRDRRVAPGGRGGVASLFGMLVLPGLFLQFLPPLGASAAGGVLAAGMDGAV